MYENRAYRSLRINAPGFALLFSLLFLSFFSLLILFTAQLARSVQSDRDVFFAEIKARQNAKVALAMAMGRLQSLASEDQRAIAPLVMVDEQAPHGWLGVWDTSAHLDEPILLGKLVSENPGSGSRRTLYASDDFYEEIYAEEIVIGLQEAYAFHVSDESMKIQLGQASLGVQSLPSPVEKSPFVRKHSGVGAYLELLNPELSDTDYFPLDERVEDDLGFLARIKSLEQIDYHPVLPSSDFKYSKQDLTICSLGVLSRTDGRTGLLEDLSLNPSLLGDGLEKWMDFSAYMNPPSSSSLIGKNEEDPRRIYKMQGYSDEDPEANEIVHVVAPVVTDFGIQFSPQRLSRSAERTYRERGEYRYEVNDALLNMQMFLELWNPYAQALEIEDMQLRIKGIPEIQVFVEGALFLTLNPLEIWGQPLEDNEIAIVVDLDFSHVDGSGLSPEAAELSYWPPGRLMMWTGPDDTVATRVEIEGDRKAFFANNRANLSRLVHHLEGYSFPAGSYDINYVIPENSQISLELVLMRDQSVLARLENFEFLDVDSDWDVGDWLGRFITFQIRKMERGHLALSETPSHWMHEIDPRALTHEFGDDPLVHSYTFHESTSGTPYSPDALPDTLSVIQNEWGSSSMNNGVFLFDRRLSGSKNKMNSPRYDTIIFDLPSREILSLGELQNAYFEGLPPFALGNSWGAPVNDLFDQYFFSGQRPLAENESPKLNPVLRVLKTANADANLTPDALLVSGRFNLNTLNARVWAAILSAGASKDFSYMMPDWDLSDSNDTGVLHTTELLPPMITRFPFSVSGFLGVGFSDFKDKSEIPPSQFFHAGYHVLTERLNTRAKLEEAHDLDSLSLAESLGEAIVLELKARRHPLRSVSDFVNSDQSDGTSVLERALRRVPELRQQMYSGGNWQQADERSPAYTLPSDLLTILAPVSSIRGDTFKIRSYGRAEVGLSRAESYCEAVVQRLPDLAAGGGRIFEIVSFAWMDREDL